MVYKAGSHHAEHVTYDVFGDPDLSAATLSTRPGLYHIDQFFHGRDLDRTTGLYYDGDRWYDPVAQRFISENDGGYDAENPYLYRNNNPNKALDTPSGLFDTFPAFRDWFAGRSDTELFLGTALVAVPLGIAAGPSVAAAVPTTYATGMVLAGGAAGGIAGVMQAQAGVSNASWSDYTIGAGLGGVFGMISPIGGFADLGGTIVGGALDCRFGSGDFYGQGMVWGGLAGGIIGGGIEQEVYARLPGWQFLRNYEVRFDPATLSMSGFGGVRIARRVGGPIGSELFPNSIQVKYGEGLSALAQSRRLKGGAKAGINLSVIEYMDDGVRRHKLFKSVPDLMHSEEIAYTWLTKRGLDPESVTRLYSEFHPCSDRCDDLVRQVFPKAQIEYTWPYKSQSRKDFISNIGRRLKRETLGG